MAKRRDFACVVLLLAALASPSSGAERPAGAATAGSCGLIVMSGGDIVMTWVEGTRTCDFPPHPWAVVGNVFSSAGHGALGQLIGMNQNWQCLASNGDWFQLSLDYNSCGSAAAAFLGNVFELTGVSLPGEEFVAFGGGGPSGGDEYAATNKGNVYRWDNCTPGSPWSYIGATPNTTTNDLRTTWGRLKQAYR